MIVPKKKGDGSIRGYEVRAYDPSTREMTYVGFRKDEKAARRLEGAKETELADAAADIRRNGGKPARARKTCRELADRWIKDRSAPHAEKRWRETTRKHNEERVRAFLAAFGDQHPDDIERETALAWARDAGPSKVDVARAMLNHALDLSLCATNPLTRPGVTKGPGRKDDPPLTEDDLGRLLDACSALGAYADQFRGFLRFIAYVGCRPGEALHIERAKHIDLTADEVHILGQTYRDGSVGLTKNGRTRVVILPQPAREALDLIPPRTDSPWLFHAKRGSRLLYGSMLDYWRKVLAKSGLDEDERYPKGIDPYHLRHFCGSHLADLGADARDIAQQLGHTDGGILAQELYIHTYEDRARARLHGLFGQNVRRLRVVDEEAASG